MELLDEVGQAPEVVHRGRMTSVHGRLVRRVEAPERLTDQEHATGPQAALEQPHRPGHAVADPGGTDAAGDVNRLVGHVASRVGVHERHPFSTPSSTARVRAASVKAVLMSTPVPATP